MMTPEHKEKMRIAREAARAERIEKGLPLQRRAAKSPGKSRPPPWLENAAPPPADLTQTAEFKDAVAAAVQEQVKAVLPQLVQNIAATSPADNMRAVLAELAAQIAELNDQGSSAPRRIPPDIIIARKKAHDRMMGLIAKEARATQRDPRHEPPIFHLTSKILVCLDESGEQVIEPIWRGADNRSYPTELGWLGIPNLAMEPQNESARAIMDAFKESIGNKAATSFKQRDEEPDPDTYIDKDFALTEQGRVVTGGGVQHRKADNGLVDTVSVARLIGIADQDPLGPGYQKGRGVVMNKGASLRQAHGMTAPTKQVRVLGSIAPPAQQNG